MNSWYATGGVAIWFRGYAGILITHSPKPDCDCCPKVWKDCCNPFKCCALWCGEHYTNIIDIHFGARLNGGFPRPSWANGDVSSGYSVCDGLFQGSFTAHMEIGKPCNSLPAPEAVTGMTAEDAVATIEQDGTLIISVHPATNTTGYPPDNAIGVSLGFKPNDAFEVMERAADGTVHKRTFQARYTATLDSLGPATTGGPIIVANSARPSSSGDGPPPTSSRTVGTTRGGSIGTSAVVAGPPPVLVRSTMPNIVGEYEYRLTRGAQRVGGLWYPNLWDTTRYRFTIVGELWEKIGNAWVRATKRNGAPISETSVSSFSTGISPRIPPPSGGQGTQTNHQ
jgi:hypothetical protein